MRRTLWFALLLALLLAVPVAAQDTSQSQVSVKVIPAHTQPARLWTGMQAIPVGNSGVLVDPLDKSLVLRGTPAAIEAAQAALRVIDVPTADGRMVLRLGLGDPGAVQKAAMALPQAGTVETADRTLTFVGSEVWLNAVKGAVFRAELVHPGPRPSGLKERDRRSVTMVPAGTVDVPGYGKVDVFIPGMAPGANGASTVEVVLPDSDRLRITADSILLGGPGEELRLEGNVTITLPSGVQIRSRNAGVLLSPPGPNGDRRISIPVPPGK
jgi:hypothetical protein